MSEPNDTILADSPTVFLGMEDTGPPTGTDDVQDLSGNGHHGSTINHSSGDFQQNILNHLVEFGIDFNQTNELITIPSAVASGISDAGDTWSTFVVINPAGGSRKTVFSVANNTGSRPWLKLYVNGSTNLVLQISNDAGSFWNHILSTNVNDGVTHTVFIAAGSGTITVKLDGGLAAEIVDTSINANGAVASMTDFSVGVERDSGGDADWYGGLISRFAFWNGVKLSNAKGLEYHKAALGAVATSILERPTTNLTGLYPMWEPEPTQKTGDFSGNLRHGTPENLDAADMRQPGAQSEKLPHAIDFDAGDELIALPSSLATHSSTADPGSMGVWFSLNVSESVQWMISLSRTDQNSGFRGISMTTDGKIRYADRADNGAQVLVDTVNSYDDGAWHLAVGGTENGSSRYIDIDNGAERVVVTDSLSVAQNLNVGTLAAVRRVSDGFFYDDHLQMGFYYDTAALTTTDIAAIWDSAQGGDLVELSATDTLTFSSSSTIQLLFDLEADDTLTFTSSSTLQLIFDLEANDNITFDSTANLELIKEPPNCRQDRRMPQEWIDILNKKVKQGEPNWSDFNCDRIFWRKLKEKTRNRNNSFICENDLTDIPDPDDYPDLDSPRSQC